MKRKPLIIIALLLVLALPSCFQPFFCIHGNGILESENRSAGTFTKIENSTAVDVIFRVSNTTSITLEAESNLLDYIETDIRGNTLDISTRRGTTCLDFNEPATIVVTAPSIDEFNLSGSGNFQGSELSGDFVFLRVSGSGDMNIGAIFGSELEIKSSGSGDILVNEIESASIDTRQSGSGDLNLKGIVPDATIQITGSGDNYSQDLLVNTAAVTISGSGNVHTSIEDRLNANISGSGNIYLRGDPIIYVNITGSGRVIEY